MIVVRLRGTEVGWGGDEPNHGGVWTRNRRHGLARGTICGASDSAAGGAWYADDGVPDCVNDTCQRLYIEAPAELRPSIAGVSPDEDHGGHPDSWNDVHHRTRPTSGALYDVMIARVAAASLTTSRPHGTANMPTTYRVVLETETRPREAAVALDHLRAIQVDAPDVDIAARLALSHHIDSRSTPPPAGTSFGLIVIKPPPCDPNVPRRDLDNGAEVYRLNVEYWPTAINLH